MTDYWQVARDVCTPKQLRILELRDKHNMSWRQIESAVGVRIPTLKAHYRAAAFKVRSTLKEAAA